MTGGALWATSSPLSVRGRCSTKALSFASRAMLEISPSFICGGTFGQPASLAKVGTARPCASASAGTSIPVPTSASTAAAATARARMSGFIGSLPLGWPLRVGGDGLVARCVLHTHPAGSLSPLLEIFQVGRRLILLDGHD